ncbi:hypothetical protein C7W93_15340 [Glaciimonas sp. PCH181]|nr:hypothetical protein C7W93_15340 [Glaciimonas sp. PCH181]
MKSKSIRAIYCDDIRLEIGGKQSYMGVYNTDLLAHAFPLQMPKFCAQVMLTLPTLEAPKNLRVLLLYNDQTLSEITLDEATLGSQLIPEPDPETLPEDQRLGINFSFVFAPLLIETASRIKLRAYIDGEEIKGNTLIIRSPTNEERIALNMP